MVNCPFWSSDEESVKCYDECPMQGDLNKGEECVFREYLDEDRLGYGISLKIKGFFYRR